MNPTKLTDSILEKIKAEEIQPRSKWYYRARYSSFWLMFGAMLLIGALSFAVMLYAVNHTDFEIFDYVDNGGITQLLTLMPFVWVLAIGIAIGLGVWGLKHTKRGYRMALLMVFGGNVLGSILLGSIVYGVGGGEIIEEVIEETVPAYESVREKHEKFWGNPEKTGRLAGMVESINDDIVTVSGPRGREWEVPLERLQKAGVEVQVGQPIKMKGKLSDQKRFAPDRVREARGQQKIQRKIRDRFQENPELRAKFEAKLSPETRETLQQLEATGEKPSRELHQQIREEIKANTTPEERMEILPPPEPRAERDLRLYRGNEDSVSPQRPQIERRSEFDSRR